MKRIVVVLLLLGLVLSAFSACSPRSEMPEGIPEDFSFSLVWGVYGHSSYDSKTGRLVKEDNATNPKKYTTILNLKGEQFKSIWDILSALDLSKYPEEYDPNIGEHSKPPMTLILNVRANGTEQIITCVNISVSFESKDPDGQAFLKACRSIIELLVSTKEWQALPEYEFIYE